MDDTINWKPDPFGVHELRFFSADGKPTLLVMDGGTRSYDKPPTDQTGGASKADQLESDLVAAPPFIPALTQPAAPTSPLATSSVSEELGLSLDGEPPRDKPQSEADLATREPVSISAPQQLSPPSAARVPEPTTHPAPLEANQEQVRTLVQGPTSVAAWDPAAVVGRSPPADVSPRHSADDLTEHEREVMSRALKIAYGVVFGVLALSALGVLYVHLHHSNGAHSIRAAAPTTTTTSPPAKKASTGVLPSRLSPSAEVAADDLVTSWSTNNRLGALAVATPTAATTLFSVAYTSGLAISRGCSTSISPIVCTFGPPGGASPTDLIYQIRVSQVAGGWYVSSVRIEN